MKQIFTMLLLVTSLVTTLAQTNFSLKQEFVGKYDYVAVGGSLSEDERAGKTKKEFMDLDLQIPNTATIEKAYLYWANSGSKDTEVILDGQSVNAMDIWKDSRSLGWFKPTATFNGYACEITNAVKQKRSGKYRFSGLKFSNGYPYNNMFSTLGVASIIVVYKSENLKTVRLNIFDGFRSSLVRPNKWINDEMKCVPSDCVDEISITCCVWEGDSYKDEKCFFNDFDCGPNSLNGSSGPNCDIDTYKIPNPIDGKIEWKLQAFKQSTQYGKAYEGCIKQYCIVKIELCDSDGDGIPDILDKCPTDFGLIQNLGCPVCVDSDNDGICNEDDNCPNEPGLVSNNGCPDCEDSDNDGICNEVDDCPNDAGLASNNGCPICIDSDNDGICNEVDSCPDEAGSIANGGCPVCIDSDGDGICNEEDNCPNEVGPISNSGCPVCLEDQDGDGIADNIDECPDKAGPLDNFGCPECVDSDNDGICNEDDDCPNDAGLVSNNGCPVCVDSDSDGICNEDDECPDEAGLVSNNGCPACVDSDNDGICNEDDVCPDEAGIPENDGCPNIIPFFLSEGDIDYRSDFVRSAPSTSTALNNGYNIIAAESTDALTSFDNFYVITLNNFNYEAGEYDAALVSIKDLPNIGSLTSKTHNIETKVTITKYEENGKRIEGTYAGSIESQGTDIDYNINGSFRIVQDEEGNIQSPNVKKALKDIDQLHDKGLLFKNKVEPSDITSFPNPTDDYTTIQSSKKVDGYEIYNLSGSLLFSKNVDAQQEFKVTTDGLSTGVYMVQLNFEDGTQGNIKLMKK